MTSAAPTVRQSALCLAALAFIGGGALVGVANVTSSRIEANRVAAREFALATLLRPVAHDNRPQRDVRAVGAEVGPVTVVRSYQATSEGALVADIVELKAPGYAAPIEWLLAVSPEGQVLGTQLIAHEETPGLGDRIEPNRTDWLAQFLDKSLNAPARSAWRVRRERGQFDALTGATVTSRALVGGIAAGLVWLERERSARVRASNPALPPGTLGAAASAGRPHPAGSPFVGTAAPAPMDGRTRGQTQ